MNAIEGFRWLREFDYNVEWFTQSGPRLREYLGTLSFDTEARETAADFLEGAIEHCSELHHALGKLLSMTRHAIEDPEVNK